MKLQKKNWLLCSGFLVGIAQEVQHSKIGASVLQHVYWRTALKHSLNVVCLNMLCLKINWN